MGKNSYMHVIDPKEERLKYTHYSNMTSSKLKFLFQQYQGLGGNQINLLHTFIQTTTITTPIILLLLFHSKARFTNDPHFQNTF
mmetsp:Transcript_31180/g.38067  ORF Transcript_31180/g.38067 Transcript_31180/m.38067 type:complete len:84 (+) Transcript_31180:24-275(+)